VSLLRREGECHGKKHMWIYHSQKSSSRFKRQMCSMAFAKFSWMAVAINTFDWKLQEFYSRQCQRCKMQ
jgi:hypothetical protein